MKCADVSSHLNDADASSAIRTRDDPTRFNGDELRGAGGWPFDSARTAMTDFALESPFTVPLDLPVDRAQDAMQRLGVGCLLVTDSAADTPDQEVVGLITQPDLRYRQPPLPASPLVRDVMTPVSELPVIHYESLKYLSVHDLYTCIQGTGACTFLVVERDAHESVNVRGLVHRATVANRLRDGSAQCP